MRINYLYGLELELDHDFYMTNLGRKYTITRSKSEVIVDKMLQINDRITRGRIDG